MLQWVGDIKRAADQHAYNVTGQIIKFFKEPGCSFGRGQRLKKISSMPAAPFNDVSMSSMHSHSQYHQYRIATQMQARADQSNCLRRMLTYACYGSQSRSRFFILCIGLYLINLAFFMAAIATYISIQQQNHQTDKNANGQFSILAASFGYHGDRVDDYVDDMPTDFEVGKVKFEYQQSGFVFYGGGDFYKFHSPVVTSVVQQVPLEERVTRMFPDENGENRLMALAPALTQHRGRIRIFQRLWMSQNEKAHQTKKTLLNTMPENYVLQRELSLNYQVRQEATLVPIPVTTNCVSHFSYRTDGPMDARSFVINGTLYLSFHMWHIDAEFKKPRSRLFLWNEDTRQMSKLKIANYTMLWTEINWVPLVINGTLYFTYSFDPLRVIQCPDLNQYPIIWCNMVYMASEDPYYKFSEWIDAFRGGSPWVHYEDNYYISFAHTHYQYIKEMTSNESFVEGGIYSANMAVLKVVPGPSPTFRIVYISDPMLFNHRLLRSGDITRSKAINWPFVFPVGVILRNRDVADIGAHVNDARGFILRFHGLIDLMDQVIETDSRNIQSTMLDEHSDQSQPEFGLVHKLAREGAIKLRETEQSESFP